MFNYTYNSGDISFIAWPNGKAYEDQYSIVVGILSIMRDETVAIRNRG